MRFHTEPDLRATRRHWRAFHILSGVVDAGVLEHLEVSTSTSLDDLAERTGLDRRVLRVCLDVLVSSGLLLFDGGYRLAENALWVLSCFEELRHEVVDLAALPQMLRDGQPVQETRGGVDRHDDAERGRFLEGLARRAEPSLAEAVRLVHRACMSRRSASPRVLDFGGGHGRFAASFATALPNAEVVLFDQPETLPHARRLSGHDFKGVGGDFFVDDPGGLFDVIFLSNVVHGESPLDAARVLRNVTRALAPGGTLIVRDRLVHDDRNGPDFATDFGVTLAMYTDNGHTRTRGELIALLTAAGLDVQTIHSVPDKEYHYAVATRGGA